MKSLVTSLYHDVGYFFSSFQNGELIREAVIILNAIENTTPIHNGFMLEAEAIASKRVNPICTIYHTEYMQNKIKSLIVIIVSVRLSPTRIEFCEAPSPICSALSYRPALRLHHRCSVRESAL